MLTTSGLLLIARAKPLDTGQKKIIFLILNTIQMRTVMDVVDVDLGI